MRDKAYRQLAEDRALRNAAQALFKADIAQLRQDLAAKGVGARAAERMGEGAVDLADDALSFAETNKGKVSALLSAIVLWFARGPIMEFLGGLLSDESEDQGPATDNKTEIEQ